MGKPIKTRKPSDNNHFAFQRVDPMTRAQSDAYDAFDDGYNLFQYGSAGTGKSFIALSLALDELLNRKSGIKRINIIRSAVQTRPIGFTSGNKDEKESLYEEPYVEIVNTLIGRGDAYQIMKQKKMINFTSTSFLRSVTYDDAITIADECQSMSFVELDTVITRIGQNSRIIFCGDKKQDDLTSKRYNEESGFSPFFKIIENLQEFDLIEYTSDDIVRSGLVKSYIKERERQGL